jgi:hypothetical protein
MALKFSPSQRIVECFADFRLTSWKVCWSLAITERLSPMSNQRKRVNYSGEEKVAILRAHFVEWLPSAATPASVRSKPANPFGKTC